MATNPINSNGTTVNYVPKGLELKLTTALAGAQGSMPANFAITVNGSQLNASQLATQLQGMLQPMKAVHDTRATLKSQVTAKNAQQKPAQALLNGVKLGVSAQYGASSDVLAKLGFKPQKTRAPLTPAQKLIRNQKAQATRKARNTLGSQQRAAIRGTLTTGVYVATDGTVSSPPATTPTAAPGPKA
jgi:hypothetical protein